MLKTTIITILSAVIASFISCSGFAWYMINELHGLEEKYIKEYCELTALSCRVTRLERNIYDTENDRAPEEGEKSFALSRENVEGLKAKVKRVVLRGPSWDRQI